MIILWGSTSREKVVESGDFFCPECRAVNAFSLVDLRSYFTLYFIPLFPTGSLGKFVECHGCGGRFNENVLHLTETEIEELQHPPWNCAHCGARNSAKLRMCNGCNQPRPGDGERSY